VLSRLDDDLADMLVGVRTAMRSAKKHPGSAATRRRDQDIAGRNRQWA
jgi:hypothetical protein